MFGNRLPRDGQIMLGDQTHRQFIKRQFIPFSKFIQYLPAGRIVKCFEDCIFVLCHTHIISNQQVACKALVFACMKKIKPFSLDIYRDLPAVSFEFFPEEKREDTSIRPLLLP